MKELKLERIMGMLGVFIWAATIFLRESSLMGHTTSRFILGVAPNFGVVWLLYWLIALWYQNKYKREIKLPGQCVILGIILAFLFLSEVIHQVFMDSPFDIWDIIASCLAVLILLICIGIQKGNAYVKKTC